jgi:hypothetical protein
MARYLIWSNQQRMWWRPNERGYTEFVDEAGRYDRATADRIVAKATCDGRLKVRRQDPVTDVWYEQLPEVLILAPEDTPEPDYELVDETVPDGRVIGRAPVDEPGLIVGDTAVEQRDNAYAAYERDEAEPGWQDEATGLVSGGLVPNCPTCGNDHHTVEPCR